jgi:hypothetical protein
MKSIVALVIVLTVAGASIGLFSHNANERRFEKMRGEIDHLKDVTRSQADVLVYMADYIAQQQKAGKLTKPKR